MNVKPLEQQEVDSNRFRLASPDVATTVGGVVFALLLAAVPLTALTRDLRLINDGSALALVLVVLVVGVGIARHRPRNPIGWLALATALTFALSNDARLYSVLAYHVHGGRWPFGPVAVALADTLWVLAFLIVPVLIVLFPDGVLPSPPWRWVLRAYLAAAVVILASTYTEEAVVIDHPIRIDPLTGQSLGSVHLTGVTGWISAAGAIEFVMPAFWLLFVGRQVAGWRGATGDRRQQLKWLMTGAAIVVLAGLANFVAHDALSGTTQRIVADVSDFGVAALPVSIGVGILRYRLYEIDRLISRTISYAILTGLLAGIFVGIVVLSTDVLPFSSPVGVAASTLAAAGLFNPLRVRVQRLVDRRFNRARYDAEAIVAAFTLQLRDAVDLDTVRGELLRAVEGAVQPAYASVWIRPSTPRSRLPSSTTAVS